MLGLYVHIPFCTRKCHYCNFVVTTAQAPEKKEEFLTLLEREMAHTAPAVTGRKFETIYLGGGTPSTLSPGQMTEVFAALRRHFSFTGDAEITCEANPGDLDAAKAKTYRELGINRISFGAQSFNDATLRRINRAHGVREIGESFAVLRNEGFKNISVDLIVSLPGETLKMVEHSLNELMKLNPEHVSVYELTIEEKTVFGKQHRDKVLELPGEAEQLAMLSFAREFLQAKGFIHYELLNYARPGFESRHNRLYWANREYLGLGPGAFSYFGGRRFRNSRSVEEYREKTSNNDWSAAEEETLTPEKAQIESFLLSLRLREGADLKKYGSIADKFETSFAKLLQSGLITSDNRRVRLTSRGQLFAETVFTELSSV